MIKHKNAVIACVIIAIALIATFVRGGNAPSLTTDGQPADVSQQTENQIDVGTDSNISSQPEQESDIDEYQEQPEQLQPVGNSEPKAENAQTEIPVE